MQICVSHTTRYRFEAAPNHGLQRLRLKPRSGEGQTVLDWTMEVVGAQVESTYDDHNGNQCTLISFTPGSCEVAVSCSGVVQTAGTDGIIGPQAGSMPLWAFVTQTDLTRPGPRLRELADRFSDGSADLLERLHGLSAAVRGAVAFAPGQTDAKTNAEAALGAGAGVCQDHAHIFIAAARLLDVPARYVSGYLLLNETINQQAGHGWAEAHLEGLGWVGFDVANGTSPDERYVRVATGCDYRDAAPVTGITTGGGPSELSVSLSVDQNRMVQQQSGRGQMQQLGGMVQEQGFKL